MIGSLMICTSAVILLVGMLAGIAMGIQQNFVLRRRMASQPDRRRPAVVVGVMVLFVVIVFRTSRA
jgi:hypothetical protein